MATTSSIPAAGKALADKATGQGGSGKGTNKGRAAAVATAALGLSLVVGGILGQGRQAQQAVQPQAITTTSVSARPVEASMTEAYRWDFGQARPADASITVEYRWSFGSAAPALDWEQQERRQAAPLAFAPDPFTYREDRRVGLAAEYTPDQFTYREDRRVDGAPALVPPAPANVQGEDR